MKALLLLVLPATLLAQRQPARQAHTCQVYVDSVGGQTRKFTNTDGTQNWYSGGGVFAHCINEPTTISSDSMAYVQALGELQFVGNVHYRDSTALLDSDQLTYWTRLERLFAEGHVYTRNTKSGTELRGPNMDYYRAVPPIRDTVDVIATQRPTIRLVPENDSTRADTANPFIIVADRVKLRHNDRFWGSGHVTIDRSDLHAKADSAMLNTRDSLAWLIGAPEVVGRDTSRPASDTAASYRLVGQRIRFDLDAGQHVRRVRSYRDADASGPDWKLTADTIDLAVDSSKIQRAQAWGTERRPVATSGASTIIADSLDIHMPGQVMELVWAFRMARANTKPDSGTTQTEDDWLFAQDSMRANFVSAVDSLGHKRSDMDRVIAYGAARAYYHTENSQDPAGQKGVNYSRGDRINIALEQRKVKVVDIVGHVDGIYLEPMPPSRDTIPDSLRVDSLRVDSLHLDTARVRARLDSIRPPAPVRPITVDDTLPERKPRPAPRRPATPAPARRPE